jgi:hypothetical protein
MQIATAMNINKILEEKSESIQKITFTNDS